MQRQVVAGAVSRLYVRRIAADYQPRFSVGPATGHEALRDMNLVTQILGGNR
ncbi:MAG TPA: hypothetical protein VD997_10600 [Phycisphaerales bacterium]|nr:hypothetical protein [Phycisphaerales bacterium]